MESIRYQDAEGREIFVGTGISGQFGCPVKFATYRRKPHRVGTHRVSSPKLPLRHTEAEAQADLDAYALRKGWIKMSEIVASVLPWLYFLGTVGGLLVMLATSCSPLY